MDMERKNREIRKWKERENRLKLLAILGPLFLYIIVGSSFDSFFDSRVAVLGLFIVTALGVGLRIYIAQYCKKRIAECLASDNVE